MLGGPFGWETENFSLHALEARSRADKVSVEDWSREHGVLYWFDIVRNLVCQVKINGIETESLRHCFN